MSFCPTPMIAASLTIPNGMQAADGQPALKRPRAETTHECCGTQEEAAAALPFEHSLTPAGASVARLATELTAALRLLDRGPAPQSDMCAGFFSARLPDSPSLFVSGPTHGTFWREVTPDAFGVFPAKIGESKPHRERVCGQGPLPNYPSTAVPAAIYSHCPDIHAVVHAHPKSMMALSALSKERANILPISEPSFSASATSFTERLEPHCRRVYPRAYPILPFVDSF